MKPLAFAAMLLATPATAASITESDLLITGGERVDWTFESYGVAGTGRSVIGDGRPVQKSNPNAPHAFGRSNPYGGSWTDSQDGDKFKLKVTSDERFSSLTFALTDAFDQKKHREFSKSHFEIRAKGASWEIPKRQKNGTANFIEINFLKPVRKVTARIFTRQNDGFGISNVCVKK